MSTKVRTRNKNKGQVKAHDAASQTQVKTATQDVGTKTDVTVDKAKLDLVEMLSNVQRHFDGAAEKFFEADAQIRAEGVEKHDVDFTGKTATDKEKLVDAGVDKAKDYLTDKAIDKGTELAEHADVGVEGVPVVGWAVSICKAGNKWVKEIFDAKHSKARRMAMHRVVTAARADMREWIKRVTAEIKAAETVEELRTIGQTEIIPMLDAVQNEVAVAAQLQAYVLKLTTADPSFTSSEGIDEIRDSRKGFGTAMVEQAAEQ